MSDENWSELLVNVSPVILAKDDQLEHYRRRAWPDKMRLTAVSWGYPLTDVRLMFHSEGA